MASNPLPSERRGHVRFSAHELNGLRAARVKYGGSIDVIDLSAGGVLFETAAPLTPAATIVLEFSGPTKSVLIPSHIVRCRSLRTIDYLVRSQGACAFRRPLGLKDLVIGAPQTDRETTRTSEEDLGNGAWLPVIGKCRDGRLVSGFTNDFSPSQSSLHISPARSEASAQHLELANLEALFFLRDPGDTREADHARGSAAPYGRKVALLLPGGERLTGSTLNYSRQTSGVFVYPHDSDFGVARVFVTPSGIHNVRLL